MMVVRSSLVLHCIYCIVFSQSAFAVPLSTNESRISDSDSVHSTSTSSSALEQAASFRTTTSDLLANSWPELTSTQVQPSKDGGRVSWPGFLSPIPTWGPIPPTTDSKKLGSTSTATFSPSSGLSPSSVTSTTTTTFNIPISVTSTLSRNSDSLTPHHSSSSHGVGGWHIDLPPSSTLTIQISASSERSRSQLPDDVKPPTSTYPRDSSTASPEPSPIPLGKVPHTLPTTHHELGPLLPGWKDPATGVAVTEITVPKESKGRTEATVVSLPDKGGRNGATATAALGKIFIPPIVRPGGTFFVDGPSSATLSVGGEGTTIDGISFSAATGGVVVDGSTPAWHEVTRTTASQSRQSIVSQGETSPLSAQAEQTSSSADDAKAKSSIGATEGLPLTTSQEWAWTTRSLAQVLQPSPTTFQKLSFVAGDQTVTATWTSAPGAKSSYVLIGGSMTLRLGDEPVTVAGERVSVGGAGLVVGNKVIRWTSSTSTHSPFTVTTTLVQASVTVGGRVVDVSSETISQDGKRVELVVINHLTTLTVGGKGVTISGTSMSAGATALIVKMKASSGPATAVAAPAEAYSSAATTSRGGISGSTSRGRNGASSNTTATMLVQVESATESGASIQGLRWYVVSLLISAMQILR